MADLKLAADFFNKGVAALTGHDPKQALVFLLQAEKLVPSRASVLENIAAAYLQLDQFEEARSYLDRVLASDSHRPMALLNRAGIASHFDQFEDSLKDLYAVADQLPSCHEAWNGIGISLEMKGDVVGAREAYKKAICIKRDFAEAHQNLALLDLAQANFGDGWWRYEWRWDNPNYTAKRKFPVQPGYWDKKSPLLVWGEHGVGDQILYGTYLQDLLTLANVDVYLLGNAKLNPLFQAAFSNTRLKVIEESDIQALLGSDIWNVPMASVPHFMNINFGRYPAPSPKPYLSSQKVAHAPTKITDGVRVGISWKSKNERFGARKSASLKDFLHSPGETKKALKFINLQYGNASDDIAQLDEHEKAMFDPTDHVDKFDDLLGLQRLMSSCDLIVTTSNTTAHLAGACGFPTYVLLPQGMARFWYWHRNRSDSPWYASVKLVEVHQNQWAEAVRSSIREFTAHQESRS
jgi:tetratricopeptide (TPR) repeat protein